ncbi:MAG TPA: glycosyltransferase 87 family protein [Microbacteriaceae bacterium]|nr:glycosyltransferase 87 family protein [Microbacteriaceae bacterium]
MKLRTHTSLWIAFAAVHLILSALNIWGPGFPMGDVTRTYVVWAIHAREGLDRVGIDQAWVYPILAFLPMTLALYLPFFDYGTSWLLIVAVLDAAAFALLLGAGPIARSRRIAAIWWLGFMLALGPITLGRIDAITIPFALAGLLWAAGRPRVASLLLVIGAWIKVWPGALWAALVMSVRRRAEVVVVAIALSIGIAVTSLLAGAGWNTFGFVAQQAGRGLQVESLGAIPFLWAIVFGSQAHSVVFNFDILTFEVIGPNTATMASVMTPFMALGMALIAVVGYRAVRSGASTSRVLPELALGFTMVLIFTNKVGSPQYIVWLAPVVVYGFVIARRRMRTPARLSIGIAILTQLIYPYFYSALLEVQVWQVIVMTLRAGLEAWLLVWVIGSLWDAGRGSLRADLRSWLDGAGRLLSKR